MRTGQRKRTRDITLYLIIFFMTVAYSADVDTEAEVRSRYDSDMTVSGSFAALFSHRAVGLTQEK